jgi:hypothetical protein
VYAYSGGTPRLINILCDNGMLTAYALGHKSVEVGMIHEIAHDLNLADLSKKSAVTGADATPIKLWGATPPAPVEENNNNADVAGVKPQAQYDAGRSFPKPVLSPKAAAEEQKPPGSPRPGPAENSHLRAAKSGVETVPSRSLDLMMTALTEAMGPMAPLVVREQIDAMGESLQSFPKQRLGQLVEVTSREILSEGLKARYRILMSEEIRAIHVGKEEP